MLRLRLLGNPKISLADVLVAEALSAKAQAILIYLAVTNQPQPRSTLASLLWGDVSESAARNNLRKTLANLREQLAEYLDLDGQIVAFKPDRPYWVDVTDFVSKIELSSPPLNVAQLQEAVELYRGDFLAGYYVRHAPDFEIWMLAEQARLRELVIQALHALAAHHTGQGDFSQAIGDLRRLLSLEPWREEAHQQLMRLLAQTGQRGAALAQYEICRQVLAEELGVEPGEQTTNLYEQIRAGDLGRTTYIEPKATKPLAPRHNLPPQPTTFVGREKELADIIRRLSDRDCRLLTLVGPGGIGKTRLALQTAQTFVDAGLGDDLFSHGILFVSLVAVDSTSSIVAAIAEAANFTFYSNVPPQQQLLDYLREKKMLLILDNLEHVLDEGTELISEILAVAPEVKILVTSRETLNLHEAWFHPISGMSFPPAEPQHPEDGGEKDQIGTIHALEKYDAVRLFVQSASRARIDFSLAAEQAHVVRICRLVEGMPLGIELAAAWLKMLSPERIVQEIEQGLDIFSTRLKNIPERHRNVRAVFEQSWRHLTDNERAVLQQLSVFRGAFDQEAAEQVAGTSLLTLALLVEKSLLRVTETGRYHLHELLRQFAAEKLAAVPHQETAARERHSAYYLGFLKTAETKLIGKGQQAALVEISLEIENVRAGWQWAVAQNNLAALHHALTGLYNFYQIRSRYQEGEEIFAQAALHLQQQAEGANRPVQAENGLLGKLTARRGALCVFLGHYEAANKYLQAGLELANDQSEIAFILNMLGEVARWQVRPSVAEAYLRRSLLINREIGNASGLVSNLNNLTLVAGYSGNYSEGKKLATESLEIARQLERPDLIASSLQWLAWSTNYLGQYEEAETYWQESLAICREIGDQNGIGQAINFLGWVAWCVGGSRLAEAVVYHHQALAIYREIGNRSFLSMALADLALAVYEQGDYEAARQHSAAGLALAEEIGNKVFTCYNRYCLGAAVCALGDFSTGRKYLAEALRLAWDIQILPHAVNAIFFFAQSFIKESETANQLEQARLQQKATALKFFTFIARYLACWHATRMRAAHLQAELEADLPADMITTAKAQAKNQTLEEIIGELPGNIINEYGS